MSTRIDSIRMLLIYGDLTFHAARDAVDAYLDQHPDADTSEVIAAVMADEAEYHAATGGRKDSFHGNTTL